MSEPTNFMDAMRAPAAPPIKQPPANCVPVDALAIWHAAIGGTAPEVGLMDTNMAAASWLGQFDLAKNQNGGQS